MESYRNHKAAALRQVLDDLEKSYGLNSEEFMAARASRGDDRLAGVPDFTRHAWANVYDELHELIYPVMIGLA